VLRDNTIAVVLQERQFNILSLDIDGRPRFAKLSIDNVKKVEIAAIDPDFIEAETSVPDGMR